MFHRDDCKTALAISSEKIAPPQLTSPYAIIFSWWHRIAGKEKKCAHGCACVCGWGAGMYKSVCVYIYVWERYCEYAHVYITLCVYIILCVVCLCMYYPVCAYVYIAEYEVYITPCVHRYVLLWVCAYVCITMYTHTRAHVFVCMCTRLSVCKHWIISSKTY